MAGRTYKLQRGAKLDRDALLRALNKLDLGTWSGRWKAVLVCQEALILAQAGDCEDWLWGYGVQLALRGHELSVGVGPCSGIAEGYRAGAGLLPRGMPLELDAPLGQRKLIGTFRPWIN